jgi:hypothetical protein
MNIVLLSYRDFDFDGRLRELVKTFSMIGKVYSFTRSKTALEDNLSFFNGQKGYFNFINRAIAFVKSIKVSIDLLVIDDRRSIIPAFLIKLKYKPKHTVIDCRELYFFKEAKKFSSKIGCLIEKQGIIRSDIVIAANKERAELMYKHYRLKSMPLVFENIRKLSYSSPKSTSNSYKKIEPYLMDDAFKIVSTAGCIIDRGTDILVKNFKNVTHKSHLFLVGNSDDKSQIERIIFENKVFNVHILESITQSELKALLNYTHIGIVNYNQLDFNNKYCASGKLYEFIYEKIPVVTTTNPPLKRICDQYGVGIADDEYYHGINAILENYQFFKSNADAFSKNFTVESNNISLKLQILNFINDKN